MANTTETKILTAAGRALLAQVNAEEVPFKLDKLIFANIPDRADYPQPDDGIPTDYVVFEKPVEQRGRLSTDVVIYTTTLTSEDGPFEFNWTGGYSSEHGVLVTIDHHKLTPKTANEPGIVGNTLVRSINLEYKDVAEITNITVDASSFQYDATPRMKKMDDDAAQAIIDQNGKDWFIEDGFLVTPQSTAYNIKAGSGYVSGNRVTLEFDRIVQSSNKPSFIYVDAHREGTPTGEQVTLFDFVITADEKDDYTDANGVNHFVCKIAQVLADGSVSDLRPDGESASRTWVKETIPEERFKTHGSGTRSARQRFSDRVSILDVDENVEGGTVDATDVFNEAIEFAKKKGKEVEAIGHFGIAGTIINPGGVIVNGAGWKQYDTVGTLLNRIGQSELPMVENYGHGGGFKNLGLRCDNPHPNGMFVVGGVNGDRQAIHGSLENLYFYGNWDTDDNIALNMRSESPSDAVYYNRLLNIVIEHAGQGLSMNGQVNGNMLTNTMIKSCRRHLFMDAKNKHGALENTFAGIGFFGSSGDIPHIGAAKAITMRNGVQGNTFFLSSETSSGGQAFDIDESSKGKNTFLGHVNEVTQIWTPGWLNKQISNVQSLWNMPSESQQDRLESLAETGVFHCRYGMGAPDSWYKMLVLPDAWRAGNPYNATVSLRLSITAGGSSVPFFADVKFGLGKIPTDDGLTIKPMSIAADADFSNYVEDIRFCRGKGGNPHPAVLIKTKNTWTGGIAPMFAFGVDVVYSNVNKPSRPLVSLDEAFAPFTAPTLEEITDSQTVLEGI